MYLIKIVIVVNNNNFDLFKLTFKLGYVLLKYYKIEFNDINILKVIIPLWYLFDTKLILKRYYINI